MQVVTFRIDLKKFFEIKKVKNTALWRYVTSYLNREEIVGTFYQKDLEKTNHKRVEKVIKRKGDKLYVQWKGYDSF